MKYRTLETERLILREWRTEDAEDLYEYARNPQVGPMAGWAPHADRESSLGILKGYMESGDIWAVALRESGKVIGQLRMYPDENRGRYVAKYLSYALSADYWGQGLMTEAVRAVIRYAFEELEGIDLLSVFHSPDNVRTRRVIEKCGFEYEITLENAYIDYDGQVSDSVCYCLMKEDYLAAKTMKTLCALVNDGLLKAEDAARRAGLSEEAFGREMKKAGYRKLGKG